MARVRQMTALWTTLALCTGALALSGCGESIPVAGDEFKDCDDCPTMVEIPAGSFQMGHPKEEEPWLTIESPQHEVTIPAPFAVGKFEVTFDEWDACVSGGGCNGRPSEGNGYRPDDEGWGRGRSPVINVSWNDATSYVTWLSSKTGESYRLLSEAEWEYAARAGTTTPFYFGETITTDQANYDGNETYADGPKGEYREQTMPVGSFQQMHLVFMTCTAMLLSGQKIVGIPPMQALRRMARRGQAVIAANAFCVAGAWSAIRGSCVLRGGTGSPPSSGAMASGFVLPGRLIKS